MDKSHSTLLERPIMVSSIQSVASSPAQVMSRPAQVATTAAVPEAVQAKSEVPMDMERMKLRHGRGFGPPYCGGAQRRHRRSDSSNSQ
jgi:hypothetical protein